MSELDLAPFAGLDYCYLTTTGRKTGEPREIEIWFGLGDGTLYLMAGGREKAHWVRNIRKEPAVRVRLGDRTFEARGRIVDAESDEDALARRLLLAKYAPGYSGDLDNWGRSALPVAIEVVREL